MKKLLFLIFLISTKAFSLQTINALLVSNQNINASINSSPLSMNQMLMYDIMAYITGTATGTVKLQKNDEPKNAEPIWFDIAGTSQAFNNNATLNWIGANNSFQSLRAVVTIAAGSTFITIRANAKGN